MKDTLIVVGFICAFAAIVAVGLTLMGCPLHDPVPVEPDYPPAPPMSARDASDSRLSTDAGRDR